MSSLRQRHTDMDNGDHVPLLNTKTSRTRHCSASPPKVPLSGRRSLCCKFLGLLFAGILVGSFFLVYYTVASWRHRFTYLDPSAARLHLLPTTYVKKYDARCLDGSRPAYFITENDPQRWVVYFGSAPLYWCIDAEDCALRRRTQHSRHNGRCPRLSVAASRRHTLQQQSHQHGLLELDQSRGASVRRERRFWAQGKYRLQAVQDKNTIVVATWWAWQWLRIWPSSGAWVAAAKVLFVGVGGSGVGLMALAPRPSEEHE